MVPPRRIEPRPLLRAVILPALASAAAAVDEPRLAHPGAALLLVAIAIQESDLRYVSQHPRGPARSFWQIEPLTGGRLARKAIMALGGRWPGLLTLHGLDGPLEPVLVGSPLAACVLARLLLWCDPQPLPALGDEQAGWSTYLRVWRPGKPHPDRWPAAYNEAMQAAAGVL